MTAVVGWNLQGGPGLTICAGHVEAIVTGPPTVADARAQLMVAHTVDAVLLAHDPRAVVKRVRVQAVALTVLNKANVIY